MRILLEKGAEVNAQGGYYGNALQAASWGGHEKTGKILLEKGAEVSAQGGEYGNVLQAASLREATWVCFMDEEEDKDEYDKEGEDEYDNKDEDGKEDEGMRDSETITLK